MKLGLREIIFFMLMLGLLGSTWYFVLKRNNEKRLDAIQRIEKREKDLANLRVKTAGIEDFGTKLAELQKAIDFFNSKLPAEKEVDSVLKEVWQMAESNALQTRTVRQLPVQRAANYNEQPMQMTLSGDFNGFYAFLLQLEKMPRITRLTKMKLEKVNDRDGEMQAQLTLSIFFEPDAGVSASAGE